MSFRDRLVYDPHAGTYFDSGMRYIFIKPEALMGIALELPESQRFEIFEAMARSVFKNGGKSARAYQSAGANEAETLLAVITETAGQLGWGKWTAELDEACLRITVADSPFAAGYGDAPYPVCAPIAGMLRAISGMIFGTETEVQETACTSMGAPACVFEARPVESRTE